MIVVTPSAVAARADLVAQCTRTLASSAEAARQAEAGQATSRAQASATRCTCRRTAERGPCRPGRQGRPDRAALPPAARSRARRTPVLRAVGDVAPDLEVGEQGVGLELRCRSRASGGSAEMSRRPGTPVRRSGCRGRRWRATAWSCRSPRARGSTRTRRGRPRVRFPGAR